MNGLKAGKIIGNSGAAKERVKQQLSQQNPGEGLEKNFKKFGGLSN
jgi:hypothetical protein